MIHRWVVLSVQLSMQYFRRLCVTLLIYPKCIINTRRSPGSEYDCKLGDVGYLKQIRSKLIYSIFD